MTELKETALAAEHEALGASFTDFGGWRMPLKYTSELQEHKAVRSAAGLFDLSHMGEVRVIGPDAATFLNTALVGNLAKIEPGKAKYSLIVNASGGILDDLITYRIGEQEYLVIPNAGNREIVAAELTERAARFEVEVWDESEGISLIAVQGPTSAAIISSLVRADEIELVETLSYYAHTTVTIGGQEILLARTGYTGEDGFELYLPNEKAGALWRALLEGGSDFGLTPCGLACRDSLRLEAGMPLYGNELSASRKPQEAGLPVVAFSKPEDFVGRAALEQAKAQGLGRTTGQRLVGLQAQGKRAARKGHQIQLPDGTAVGEVTSGAPSPTLGQAIALGYVEVAHAEPGTQLQVDVRGKGIPFEVVTLPFYARPS
ncbi:glycine cleavage system aminomethyltransferase GcvT [Nesterenkonia alkaliphila]|uniref:Aminomethyltransferase n=1 Tax=Nesterenkonia alkaliphila TaxID=1463631 RepID=A0A7K1UJ91_9MICC|nr:glycine cleavage system aminomethyltransferase GcvT [Nesterenkonia alkaliphila]MVT26476.1 glycine cleavage system aminomethyltransferase GcvT [Nesterenkonia alkaliphila]GFZ81350.1 aminomethyltransferase [Nesterenkonia alkaliphila]